MDGLKDFLQSSTIHGLFYIGSSKSKAVQIFWILAVSCGFILGLFMIYNAFSSWEESPVISTARTKPIAHARFPRVVVCPPEGTNTILNYDILNSSNMNIDPRKKLNIYASVTEFVLKEIYEIFTRYKNMFTDIDMIKGMYNGNIVFLSRNNKTHMYTVNAKTGALTTPGKGEEYHADRFDLITFITFFIYVPAGNDIELTFDVDIEKGLEFVKVSTWTIIADYKESGHYDLRIPKGLVVENGAVCITFERAFFHTDVLLWQKKRMTGLSFNWTIVGQEYDNKNTKFRSDRYLRLAMNFFFYWMEEHKDLDASVDDNLKVLRDAQYDVLGEENYEDLKEYIGTKDKEKILQSMLERMGSMRNLKDPILTKKRKISCISDQAIQQAYDFYLRTIYTPPGYVAKIILFYEGLSASGLFSVSTIMKFLIYNLKVKSVFNKEQHMLKMMEMLTNFRFEKLVQLLMTPADFTHLENCPLSSRSNSTCVKESYEPLSGEY